MRSEGKGTLAYLFAPFTGSGYTEPRLKDFQHYQKHITVASVFEGKFPMRED